MIKSTTTSLMLCFFLFTNIMTCAQAGEADIKKIDTKDLQEKAQRPEIEQNNEIKFDDSVTKFQMPKIEPQAITTSEDLELKKTQKPSKPKVTKKSHHKPVKKRVVKHKASTHSNTSTNKSTKKSKSKIVLANRPLLLSQIKEHDKIIIKDGKRNVYRRAKSKIIKYIYNNPVPVDSSSIKINKDGSFYVTNKARFIADSKALKKAPKTQAIAQKSQASEELALNISGKDKQTRLEIEQKYNHGKTIKKEILLKNLRKNDEIYIVKGVQFVLRKKKSSSGMFKYWLIEKINESNAALQKIKNNKYKVTRAYLPD